MTWIYFSAQNAPCDLLARTARYDAFESTRAFPSRDREGAGLSVAFLQVN
jgi:hypothetical protein